MREYLDYGYLDHDGSYNERYRKSHPTQIPNPPRVRFKGKTPEEYMSFKGIDTKLHSQILEDFKMKYPNHRKLTSKKTKTRIHEADWNRFIQFVKDYKCS